MIVCAAASPSIDKLFVFERLEAGAVHRPREFLQLPGGKAINVARAVIALGGRVEAVGLAGGHAGRWLGEATDTEGIPARFVRCGSETRASLSVLDLDRGLLTEFYEAAAPVERAEWAAFSSAVASALGGGDWLAISGSLPADAPADGYAELVARAHPASALRTHGGDAEGVAVVTHGEEGAALALRDGSLRTGRLGTRGPFAVGSGDAFLAGLL